jgi:hypothetical protein
MSPVPGVGPAPTTPIGWLKENPKSKARQERVLAAIFDSRVEVRDLEPLLVDPNKDLVRAAVWIAANADAVEPSRVEPKVLVRIEDPDKRVAIAVVNHLAEMGKEDREAAVYALGETALARHITELMDAARPRELKEALNGEDRLRARVAVAEVIRRDEKGEALLYEARSSKDRVISYAALTMLRSMFLSGSLKPRARIDKLWLKKARLRA